jgi:hypothetical protein
MLLNLFQNGMGPIEEYLPLIITGVSLLGGFFLFIFGLKIVKAQKRSSIKWAGYSFLIQFGLIFIVGSPLMLLGFAGAYKGGPELMIPVIVIAAFISLNAINMIHQIGLKKSLIVILLILGPITVAMRFLGELVATL